MTLPRGGWDIPDALYADLVFISIHPPRRGWDRTAPRSALATRNFNPPTPWGVGQFMTFIFAQFVLFQSTHPVGGGTRKRPGSSARSIFQSTHPVGGGTRPSRTSITMSSFQSTHPVGGGTELAAAVAAAKAISIHPPRGGWDDHGWLWHRDPNISIHPPRGGWDAAR